MNGFARGVLGLTILAGICCANSLSGCATGTEIDGPAFVPGEDTDGGTPVTNDDAGTPGDVDSGGSTGNGKDSGTTQMGTDSGPCAGEVVINEVQTAGGSASDEFVELYNPAACALSLNKFSLNYSSASASTPSAMYVGKSTDSIPSHGYFLMVGSGYAGGSSLPKITGGLANDGRLAILDGSSKVLDSVGYGTLTGGNLYVEKNAAPGPATNKSIGRKPDGHDTDSNATDFDALASPSPGAAN